MTARKDGIFFKQQSKLSNQNKMKIPEILNVLGYEVIEQKDGFITLPVEDFEKIETALAVGFVKPPVEEVQKQAPAIQDKINENFSQFEAL